MWWHHVVVLTQGGIPNQDPVSGSRWKKANPDKVKAEEQRYKTRTAQSPQPPPEQETIALISIFVIIFLALSALRNPLVLDSFCIT